MRALRTTAFIHPDQPPLTTVVIEASLRVPIEQAAEGMRSQPDVLVITDIFDAPNPPRGEWEATPEDAGAATVLATTEAMRRMDEDVERNMAILYFYNGAALRVVREAVIPTLPAPLTVEQITTVFEQLAYHPNYNGQHVNAFTEDGHQVNLKNGHVTNLPPE